MVEQHRQEQKTQLAVALAEGISAAKWARTNGVPKATAYRWFKEPAVRAQIESIRRHAIDRAVGRMARRMTWATEGIAKLAKRPPARDMGHVVQLQLTPCERLSHTAPTDLWPTRPDAATRRCAGRLELQGVDQFFLPGMKRVMAKDGFQQSTFHPLLAFNFSIPEDIIDGPHRSIGRHPQATAPPVRARSNPPPITRNTPRDQRFTRSIKVLCSGFRRTPKSPRSISPIR
jgi:hypothetical protein